MAYDSAQLLGPLLRDVSRSFYLTLRLLPGSIRTQIGLAYLLARTTDTVADTELVPLEQRLLALQKLRERILGLLRDPIDFGELARHQASTPERILLERCEDSVALLRTLDATDTQLVHAVLDTITSGQELDLRRFATASTKHVAAFLSDAELDDYTYKVAGCVGEFWTRMCRTHVFPKAQLDEASLLTNGVRFGKGLQLVNILRDLPVDLRNGRCYLPADALADFGLKPGELLDPRNEPRLRPLYHKYLDRALAHLAAGWKYTNSLPRGNPRLRLACAWPLLIGRETLGLLRTPNPLDPERRVKVSRSRVKQIMWRSTLAYPWPPAWRRLFRPVGNCAG
jgi:farnesyl-diphosphate farnesyltransferase